MIGYQKFTSEADMGVGGKRPGAGRPLGSPGLKSQALAGRLDEMGYDPAETLVRLGRRAEAAGDVDLAIKAAIALMSFRWPKLKETAIGLGLDGSIADRLDAACLRIEVTTGIPRPPDDLGIIEEVPVPPPPAAPPRPAAPPSQPKLRLAAEPPPPAPTAASGKVVPAHEYWAQMAKSKQ